MSHVSSDRFTIGRLPDKLDNLVLSLSLVVTERKKLGECRIYVVLLSSLVVTYRRQFAKLEIMSSSPPKMSLYLVYGGV
jgi:hypothetical protein